MSIFFDLVKNTMEVFMDAFFFLCSSAPLIIATQFKLSNGEMKVDQHCIKLGKMPLYCGRGDRNRATCVKRGS